MELKQWLTTLSAELATSDVTMDDDAVRTVLDLARDSAHEVERVAAPLTTFLGRDCRRARCRTEHGCSRSHVTAAESTRRPRTSLAPCAACGSAGHC